MKRLLLLLVLPALLRSAPAPMRPVPSPAPAATQCSNLVAATDGTLFLTYYGPPPSGAPDGARTLYVAALAPDAVEFSAPRPVVTTPLLLENWADFASLVVGTDGTLTAQWFQKSAPDASGYDGWFARSSDWGATWTKPAPLGHEFVALAPLSDGRTLAVWLESARVRDPNAAPRTKRDPNAPRPARDPHAPYAPSMKLISRLLAPDGSTLGEWTVDPDVCTCCQNTVTVLPRDRVFVAYRGHTSDEIRDNKSSVFDLATKSWSYPQSLAEDLWKIAACPVNGPAADSRGDAVAVAWFTAANGTARVQAKYSQDAAGTFSTPLPIDLGRPMGRIETVMLGDKTALILWMEMGTAENTAGIYARRLHPDGKLSAAQLIADTTQARASGFPRAALRPNGRVLMSWTRTGESNQVMLGEIDPWSLGAGVRTSAVQPPRSSVVLEFCAAPLNALH